MQGRLKLLSLTTNGATTAPVPRREKRVCRRARRGEGTVLTERRCLVKTEHFGPGINERQHRPMCFGIIGGDFGLGGLRVTRDNG